MTPPDTLPERDAHLREILKKIQRSQRRQTIATGVVGLVLAVGVVFFLISAAKTKDALCNLRADLQHRVETTHKFLHEHPEGIPGVPPALLLQQASGQQRTVDALDPLGCG